MFCNIEVIACCYHYIKKIVTYTIKKQAPTSQEHLISSVALSEHSIYLYIRKKLFKNIITSLFTQINRSNKIEKTC